MKESLMNPMSKWPVCAEAVALDVLNIMRPCVKSMSTTITTPITPGAVYCDVSDMTAMAGASQRAATCATLSAWIE